jgi:micrococcal nuclease
MTKNTSKNTNHHVYKAKIVSVYDGDTCRADIYLGFGVVLKSKTIRLASIDTAELIKEEKNEAIAAKERLSELVLGKEVSIQTIKDRTGKYGRIIGTIFFNGQNINEMLVSEGLATRYPQKTPRKKSKNKTSDEKKTQKKEVAVKIEIPESILQAVSGSSE